MLIEENEVVDSRELFERYRKIRKHRFQAEKKWEDAKEQIDSVPSPSNIGESGIKTRTINISPTEEKALLLTEARDEYIDSIYDDAFAGCEAFDLLELIEDANSSMVLYLHYLKGIPFGIVAQIMGYSERHIKRFVNKALDDFDEVLADIDGARARQKAKYDEFWEISARIEKLSTHEACD